MIRISFYKYHGAGNDFILVDNREDIFPVSSELVKSMCGRHFGIGADGLILLNKSPENDFNMVYFNSDGNESTMCGNGGRCVVAFAKHLGIIDNKACFMATDGKHEANIIREDNGTSVINLRLNDVEKVDVFDNHYFIDTGSPHHVIFVNNIESTDVVKEGRKIRHSSLYGEKGANTNFVEKREGSIFVRTYERGVEDETLSCGTGVAASALATFIKFDEKVNFYHVKTQGGELKVSFEKTGDSFTQIWLEGPANYIFKGDYGT